MPTLVAALTLSALLKMAHVDLPRWHLAFWFACWSHWPVRVHAAHAVPSSTGGAAFWPRGSTLLLERTDNRQDRALHWLILIGGVLPAGRLASLH